MPRTSRSSLTDGFVAWLGFGPAREGDLLDDRVDVGDDIGDHDRGVLGFVLLDDLGERTDVGVEQRLGFIESTFSVEAVGFHSSAGQGECFLEELHGVLGTGNSHLAQLLDLIGNAAVDTRGMLLRACFGYVDR